MTTTNGNESAVKAVLLIEDDIDDREIFEDALSAVAPGIRLTLASNGIDALKILLSEELPELVFLDLNMPLKNGYECLNDIKQDARLKHLPVIIFSTSLQPETADTAYESGASLYMVKPNSYPALKKMLITVLATDWKEVSADANRKNFILQL